MTITVTLLIKKQNSAVKQRVQVIWKENNINRTDYVIQ